MEKTAKNDPANRIARIVLSITNFQIKLRELKHSDRLDILAGTGLFLDALIGNFSIFSEELGMIDDYLAKLVENIGRPATLLRERLPLLHNPAVEIDQLLELIRSSLIALQENPLLKQLCPAVPSPR